MISSFTTSLLHSCYSEDVRELLKLEESSVNFTIEACSSFKKEFTTRLSIEELQIV